MKSRIVFTAALVGGALGVAQALRSERTRSAAQGAYRTASDTARTRAAITAERLDAMARDIGSQVQGQIAKLQRTRGEDLTAVDHIGKVRAAWFQDAFGVRTFCELAALDPAEISQRMAADEHVETMSAPLIAEALESARERCAHSTGDDLTAVKHIGKVRAAWFQEACGVRTFCELAALDPAEISERIAADRQIATMSVQVVAEALESAGELCAQSKRDVRVAFDMGVLPGDGGGGGGDGSDQPGRPDPGDGPDEGD
jgi:predicted flap endonuclease-1-like 5' DNA nuclease